MAREPSIPLFLWVATAALVHILWGGGSEQVVRVLEDASSLSQFANAVRTHVEQSNRNLEIELLDESSLMDDSSARDGTTNAVEQEPENPEQVPPEEDEKKPEENTKKPDQDTERTDDSKEKFDEDKQVPADDEANKREEKSQPPKAEKKEKDPPQEIVQVDPAKLLQQERRVAVKQHVDDPDQPDNPDAEYIADQANHTDKQERARVTAMDRDDPDPNPGMEHMSPSSDPGNAHVSDLAQSDDTPGDPDKAFSESPKDGQDERVANKQDDARKAVDPTRAVFGEAEAAAKGTRNGSPNSQVASRGQEARDARLEHEASDKLLESATGTDAVPFERERQAARAGQLAKRHQRAPQGNGGRLPSLRGSASLGLTPGGLNPNLTPLSALSAVGADQLLKERVADGERRRTKHRGSWRPMGLERWKSAIENYVAAVQPGNQTSLNTARVPFASYLNQIHQRLHSVFALGFLPSLDGRPAGDVLNRPDLKTNLEIVLSREDGRVIRMGVTRASGSTAFDVGALESVQKASPFGTPPRDIVSPDGNVYLHWEFHRDPIFACSTYFARPFILRNTPSPAPLPPPNEPAMPADGEQHGLKQDPDSADGTKDG